MAGAALKPRVLIAEPLNFSDRAVALLRERAHVELRDVAVGSLREALAGYDAVWVRLKHRIDSGSLVPGLKVIACPVTGLDHIDLEACGRARVRVVSLKGEVEFLKGVRATAELTVALTLGLMRRLPAAADSVKRGEWRRDLFRGNELYGKTAGIVGVGRLGSLVAGYFQAFGMRVVGYDVRPAFPSGVFQALSLDALLQESDVVSIHVAYDATTRGLIGAKELATMRRGSVLVNTSRGPVIDEPALLAALESGQLGGAALDVLTGEPDIDQSHPLVDYARRRENLLIVPHIGGNTIESFEKTELFLASKLLEALGA